MKPYFIICFFLMGNLLAQTKLGNDFKISTENTPSSFIQQNPRIFINDTAGFIASWQDYRKGEPSYYAQIFNSEGISHGNNFPTERPEDIKMLNDGSFILLFFEDLYYGDFFDYYSLCGRIYYKDGGYSKKFTVASPLGYCDFRCTGDNYEVIEKSDTVYLFCRIGDIVELKKIDHEGNIIKVEDYEWDTPRAASDMSVSMNIKGNFVLGWFNNTDPYWDYNENIDSLTFGIYATFFDSAGSMIIKNKLIKKFFSTGDYFENAPMLKSVCVSDSVFCFMWIDKDSLTFNYVKYDDKGNQLDLIKSIKLHSGDLALYCRNDFNNFEISNERNGSFSVFVTTSNVCNEPPSRIIYNYIYKFDRDGNLIETYQSNSGYPFLSQIFQGGDNTCTSISSDGKNVFLVKYQNFSAIDTTIINDDLSGSNDTDPFIFHGDNNSYFVTWNTEEGVKGQKFDVNGNVEGNPVSLKGSKIIFSSNGKSLNIWKDKNPEKKQWLGLTVYDQDWNIVSRDTIRQLINYYFSEFDIIKLNEELFVMFYHDDLYYGLMTFNNDFELLNKLEITKGHPAPFKIFREDPKSFWLTTFNSAQLFSSELKPLTTVYEDFFTNIYLGENKFLKTRYNFVSFWPYDAIYGRIITAERDTLTKEFFLAGKAADLITYQFPNNHFLITYHYGNKHFARAFSDNGIARTDSFLIHENNNNPKFTPAVLFDNDRILFAWSEARTSGNGYDIYCSVFDYNSIVEVITEEQIKSYSLSQNYPNPFNPSTIIKYSVPEQVNVDISVYDILGKKVKMLVNETKPAGEYQISFDASALSSGVYFYKLTAGTHSQIRKMLLIK